MEFLKLGVRCESYRHFSILVRKSVQKCRCVPCLFYFVHYSKFQEKLNVELTKQHQHTLDMTDSKTTTTTTTTTATCWHKVFPGKPMRFMHLCNSCEEAIGLSLFVVLPGTGISGLCTTCAKGRSDLIEINLGADCDCMNDETATKETRPHNNSLVDVAK